MRHVLRQHLGDDILGRAHALRIGTVFVIFILVSERTVTVHKTAASMDPLTGMFNRRGFAEATSRVIRARSDSRPPGDGADLRHRPFQIDQRPLRPSGG
jgi:GGDEF domain-containing protein